MMDQVVEAMQRIPLECYGSWKDHEAIEVAINHHLFVNLLHQKCIPGAIASINVQSCYDRVTHVAGSLCAQNWDVNPRTIIAMLITIQCMKFYL